MKKRTKPTKGHAYGVFNPGALHMVVEGASDQFRWCLHCEQAYPTGSFRIDPNEPELQMCPYGGCGGDAFMDSWRWAKVREANPAYPQFPLLGVYYGLYGPMTPEQRKKYYEARANESA